MIRPYINVPRFDEGFDWDYANQLINNRSSSMYPNMNMSFTGAGEDPYARVEPEVDIETPDFMQATANDVINRPVPKRKTTSVQDRRLAVKTYNNALRAADKKAKTENQQAVAAVKKANSTLKANGQPTFNRAAAKAELEVARRRSARWKQYQDMVAYAEQHPAAVGSAAKSKYTRVNNPSYTKRYPTPIAQKRPTNNIPGLSSDSGASAYWRKKRAAVAEVNKKKNQQKVQNIRKQKTAQQKANAAFWGNLFGLFK